MKNITLIISFLFVSLLSYSQCNYTLEMNDSYGDGWGTGNSIDLTVSGVTTNYTLSYSSGSSSSVEFAVTSGDDITAQFVCDGYYCYEASYRILDSSGVELVDNAYTVSVDSGTITANCPSCAAPSALSAASITATSAEISWTSDDSSFNIEVVDVTAGGTATGTATNTGVTSPFSLSGLSSGNDYEVYVQTDCGAGETSDWVSLSFTSACDAISSFPYSFGFENLDCWTNSDSSAAWAIDQGDDYGPDSVTEGANSVFFNDFDYFEGSTGDLMSPDFDFGALTTARVSFDYWDSSGTDVVKVLVDDGSGPVVVYTTESVVSTWTTINVDLPQYANQTVKIGFRGTSVYGSTNPHIDNFMISEAPSCLEPSALSAASITATSAEISWTSDDSSFNVEVVDVTAGGTATGTATNSGVTSPYSLSGLDSNTEYEVYVQTDCGAGETSAWAGPVSFTTACSAVSDFSENFDSVTTPNLPNCWSSILDVSSSYASVGTSTAADSSSPNGVSLYNSSSTSGDIILVSPELSNLAGGTHRLKLDASNSSSTQDLEIGTLSDPTDGSTFTLIETVDLSATFLEYIIDFSTYSGNDNYIGFRRILSSTYTNVYLDNIVWEEIPSCVEPTAVSAASITATSAEISWTSDDSSFNVEVVDVTAGGTATGTATNSGVTSPYSLSGLDSNTEYEVYVQTDCGSGDTSAWAGPVSFTTEPAPIVPNYTNDFATFPGEFWSVGSGALNAGPSGTTSIWESGNFAHGSVDPAAYINIFSTNRDEWLISPSFDLSGVNNYLNVDVAATEYLSPFSSAAPVDAIWGVDDFVTLMVSEDGGSTWTELYRWDANNNPGVAGAAMPEINLSAYPTLAKFAFYAESTVSNEDIDFFVDNFQITTTSLGIEEASISQFTYFPNPVNDVLTIKAQKVVEDITVFNMLGQVVKRQTPNTRDCTVDLSAMQTGAYFVQVSIGNTVETVRILKN
jgi:hypothetical protein